MPKRLTYKRWTPEDLATLAQKGPHLSARALYVVLGRRYTRQAICAQLRQKAITKTPKRRREAASEGILGAAARQLACADCGSRHLVVAPRWNAPTELGALRSGRAGLPVQ